MKVCIICNQTHYEETIEHIIPRTLGNIHYILPRGLVCRKCNNRFARYENRVLSSSIFVQERLRLGLVQPNHSIQKLDLEEKNLYPFLTKMGFESIYKSKKALLSKYDWQPVLSMLVQGKRNPVLDDKNDTPIRTIKSIPGWIHNFRLGRNHLQLHYAETKDNRLFFHFQFGVIKAKIRLI
ncbi:MAG: HNH endonuclease [Bacteroidia bacterium]|nr:HNH endonuclease [Bacteroidia bacterium]